MFSGLLLTQTKPSQVSISVGEQRNTAALMTWSWRSASSAARVAAVPEVRVPREPHRPNSTGLSTVPGAVTVTASKGTFRTSATILAQAARWPWPDSTRLWLRMTEPLVCRRTMASELSSPTSPLPWMDTPTPMRLEPLTAVGLYQPLNFSFQPKASAAERMASR